jgi:hypothetical protein
MNWLKFKVLAILPLLLFSCNNDEDVRPEPLTVDLFLLENKEWVIEKFIDDGVDKTQEFPEDRVAIFYSNKDVFFPETPYFGSWSLLNENKKFKISIQNASGPYEAFEDEWAVIQLDETTLKMVDYDKFEDDPEDDSIEEFHFRLATD